MNLVPFTVLILVLATGAASGGGASAVQQLKAGQLLQLSLRETAVSPDGRLSVTFIKVVEDSRCPEGANCIWAGNVKVRLRLRDGGRRTDREVNSNLEPTSLKLGGLEIAFADLLPYPKVGQEIDPAAYKLKLFVR